MEDDCPICFDSVDINNFLVPCVRCNQGVCFNCYMRIYDCPFCRNNIRERPVQSNSAAFDIGMNLNYEHLLRPRHRRRRRRAPRYPVAMDHFVHENTTIYKFHDGLISNYHRNMAEPYRCGILNYWTSRQQQQQQQQHEVRINIIDLIDDVEEI